MAESGNSALAPMRGLGDFFALALDTFVAMFKWPFAWREFLEQTWFVARVSLLPAMFLAIPFTVLSVFLFNVLLVEFGAADLSGTGASITTVNEIGPFVTVLVVAGSGAAAICADLGARTIREELDALRVMGVDPVHALFAPRVLAVTLVSFLIVMLLYATYQPLRFAIEDPERQARYASVFAIVAGAFVPMNFLAVRLSTSYLHPRVLGSTSNLPAPMGYTFLVSLLAIAFLYATLCSYELAAKRTRILLKARSRILGYQ